MLKKSNACFSFQCERSTKLFYSKNEFIIVINNCDLNIDQNNLIIISAIIMQPLGEAQNMTTETPGLLSI